MMKNLTHTIPAQTCPEAWVRAVEYLIDQAPKREAYYLTLAIESPEKMTPNDFRVFDLVDDFLRSHGQPPLTTVAGTIFPANYYLRGGAEGANRLRQQPCLSHLTTGQKFNNLMPDSNIEALEVGH